MASFDRMRSRDRPFDFLEGVDPRQLSAALSRENLRTVAVVLAHIDRMLAAKVLADFKPVLRREVIQLMRSTQTIPVATLRTVAESLRERLAPAKAAPKGPRGVVQFGGPEVAAAILRYASPEVRRNFARAEPKLFRALSRFMFTFDDFSRAADHALQIVFAEVEVRTLALALKVAAPELRRRILENMSHRRAALIEEELERLGRVSLKEIESAQKSIVDLAIDMQAKGRILLDRNGELA
ncbi:MAG: FliG C-terminal domain-containing protein [Planctomycetota bacterium]